MAKNSNNLGLTDKQREEELIRLKCSYDMYEKTKAETIDKRTNSVDKNGNKKYSPNSLKETIALLNVMQKDIIDKYTALGGNIEDLKAKPSKKKISDRKKLFEEIIKKERERVTEAESKTEIIEEKVVEDGDVMTAPTYTMDDLPDAKKEAAKKVVKPLSMPKKKTDDEVEEQDDSLEEGDEFNDESEIIDESEESPKTVNIDPIKVKGNSIRYDAIPLPSKGECYKKKLSKIPVAYLTAYDENLIISPNLYKDGSFLDYMLKTKIMTNEIDTEDLLPGDRDAIILWLRASGYGPEFPVSATDSATGQKFDAVVDLSQLKYKKFNLKADTNGYFNFKLPSSKDEIKFKFLTYRDIKALDEMEIEENQNIKKTKLEELYSRLSEFISDDDDIDRQMKIKLSESMKNIKEYVESTKGDEEALFTHSVTNRMIKSIVAVNGITDRNYIEEYVKYMSVMDSSALRKFITENEPGVDFNIEVERPASLGGGSVKMFLTLDQFIFLTVA